MDNALEHFKQELGSIRTGRATPALIETVEVEAYGARSPLKQLAAITAPEPRVLLVQPWDQNIIKDIEKAIVASRSGLSAAMMGEQIRVNISPLTEESRKELVRHLRQKIEAAKMSVRNLREQAWKEIQEGRRAGLIREDDKFRGKEELQKVIDEYNKKVQDLGEAKEKEIMTV
ncbi:MAG: ribosome recycling factor [Parcubacteria group bacterium LiPW_39]|nr:MAG: ribosome recycling factor [Parcubacteria group bacterium LiPW_39]